MDRQEAIEVWRRYNQDESLFRHALAVEAAMRHFAEQHGEDVEYWGMIGLLHDIDYGAYPDEHLKHSPRLLAEAGFDQAFIRSVQSHGWGICTDVQPRLYMEKVLYAVDELTGFIIACAYVRPSRSVMDLELKSVKKKWVVPAFAAAVRRDLIEAGARELSLELDQLIHETILALRARAGELGL